MAKFQISESARHENPSLDIEAEHKKFHETMQALKVELSDKAGPVTVTRAQVESVISAFDDVKKSFFRLRNFEQTTQRLCGSVRALYAGRTMRAVNSKEDIKSTWLEQRKLAELLMHETLKTGRNLPGVSLRVRDLCGGMTMQLHLGNVTKANLKEYLSILWQDVLKRVIHEFWTFQ